MNIVIGIDGDVGLILPLAIHPITRGDSEWAGPAAVIFDIPDAPTHTGTVPPPYNIEIISGINGNGRFPVINALQ